MGDDSEIFVGFDVAKACQAVAVAEDGREGEVRFLGEIDADPTGGPQPPKTSRPGHRSVYKSL